MEYDGIWMQMDSLIPAAAAKRGAVAFCMQRVPHRFEQ